MFLSKMWLKIGRERVPYCDFKMSTLLILCVSFLLAEVINAIPTDVPELPFLNETEVAAREVFEVCRTKACKATAKEILSGMDKDTEPCVDFYNFVCKNWRQHNPDLEDIELRDQYINAKINLLHRMKELLEAPEEEDETEGFKLARKLYAACSKNDTDSNLKQIEYLRGILNEIGKWPLAENSRSVKPNVWHDVDFYFLGKYVKSWFHNVYVVRHKTMQNKFTLMVTPPKFVHPIDMRIADTAEQAEAAKAKYIKLIEDTISIMIGKEKYDTLDHNQLLNDIKDMVALEERIAAASSITDPVCRTTEMTIQSLHNLFSGSKAVTNINWISRLTLFRDIPLDKTIYVTCFKYIEQLQDIISSTDEHIIVNYIYWRFVVHTLPFIVPELRVKFYGMAADKPRWQTCVEENEALTSVHYHLVKKDFTPEKIKKAADVYDMVDAITSWRFLDFKLRLADSPIRMNIYNMHENMPLIFVHPERYFQEDEYRLRFGGPVHDTYIENMLASIKHQYTVQLALLFGEYPPIRRSFVSPYLSTIDGGAFMSERYIPPGALQLPFYHPDRPQSLNYGAFGSVAAYSIMKQHYDYLVASFYGNSAPGAMEESVKKSFIMHGKMTLDKWNAYPLKRTPLRGVLEVFDTRDVYSNHAESDALRAAYEGYIKDFNLRKWKDIRLPGLEGYNHKQLFFLAYANAHCVAPNRLGLKTVQDLSESVLAEMDLEARRKVILSLLETKEFGQAFGCEKGSWMYPINNTPFW